MNKTIAVGVGLLLLILLLLFSTTYTVKYNEVAIKATFGEAGEDSVVRDAGLHMRLPVFIDTVTKLDTRLQLVETPLEEITTRDDLQVLVRGFVLWQVDVETDDGPLEFFREYTTVDGASARIRNQFRTALSGELSRWAFPELIGEESRLADAETAVRDVLGSALAKSGVKPVSVGINRLELPPQTSRAVMERMQAVRIAVAEGQRTAGTAAAERIRAEARTKAEKIRAFASQRAEEIKARGEEEAAKYLDEMGTDEGLAIFLVWLDALESALNRNTTVILPTSVEPFHLLDPDNLEASDLPTPEPESSASIPTNETGS